MVYDFADPACYDAEDQAGICRDFGLFHALQFMFGPDWLVAPVYVYNVCVQQHMM